MTNLSPKTVNERYRRAKERRQGWEAHWRECYEYALPQRETASSLEQDGGKRSDKLFDATAPDAVEQLAASLLAQLTPPWARWFGLTVGAEADDAERSMIGAELEKASAALQSNFDRSNFAVEMHQCYLDLVTAGTACLMFEEAEPGASTAFRFTAVPLSQVAFEENAFGQLDTTYRRSELRLEQLQTRFPEAVLSEEHRRRAESDPDYKIAAIEAVAPTKGGFTYIAVTQPGSGEAGEPTVLNEGRFERSPFINFRWLKAPGEVYGRSPVMKALPDIKTANKVVELVLKNASIAITGIWQADDDGVLNPATIKLAPGMIIPKAVGSAGLTPLEAPGKFDISQIVLDDLRKNIRRALLADKLSQPNAPKMTATEVLERAAEMARVLGATYGRLQSELLTPLIDRSVAILNRRGIIPGIEIDGRAVDLEYKSPLAREQKRQDAQNTVVWLETIKSLGPEAELVVNKEATVRWLGQTFGVPEDLLNPPGEPHDAAFPNNDFALENVDLDGLISSVGGLPAPGDEEVADG